MSLVSQPSFPNTNSLISSSEHTKHHDKFDAAEATLGTLLAAFTNVSENFTDRGAPESSQSASRSPYPNACSDVTTVTPQAPLLSPPPPVVEGCVSDHASNIEYPPQQEVRPNPAPCSSTSATPTPAYPPTYPPTLARSDPYPESRPQQQHHPAGNHIGRSGGMAQSTSPSLPLQDAHSNHHTTQTKSDEEVPIDPSIAASSPTYPPHSGPYSPYPPQQEMQQHGYPAHPGGTMYTQPRPDWAGYAGHAPQHAMQSGYTVTGAQAPTSSAPAGARPGQVRDFHRYPPPGLGNWAHHHRAHTQAPHHVYSFVPIPGAQQHKRPRRRYEEIERMYKCGWNGCEKAYGTLNHLNAHVTMQSHGLKRTPEEFKEIRKEWKARKKEEESQRKAEDERARSAAVSSDGQGPSEGAPASGYPQNGRNVQLPPIGYQPGSQIPGQYQAPSGSVQQLQEYGSGSMQYTGYPASPYGAPNQMYNQHNGSGSSQPKYEN